jgi:2-haloalkanoic acid dehalogenase type II
MEFMERVPQLITFDIFGTVLDWRSGLEDACRKAGRALHDGEFDRIVDAQGELEQGEFLDYATITRRSLVDVLGLSEVKASEIGAGVGRWPLYADATVLQGLMTIAPCAAMSNSDRTHGEDVQAQLGFRLTDWLCAEDVRVYKPNPEFWRQMARRRGIEPGPDWWHVSAYADYDLKVANSFGLTTVLVERPHARAGEATYSVRDLHDLLRHWSG